MYEWFGRLVERALKVPPAPAAPPGDERTTRVFRASPRYFMYRLITWGITRTITLGSALAAAAVSFVALPDVGFLRELLLGLELAVVATLLALTLLSYAALRLDYEKRWYLVTDRSLRIREGVWNVREMTITFANIQNISISQGPIQRMLGISDLCVETAGGAGGQPREHPGMNLHTGFFRGVDNADHIRHLMRDRLRQAKDAGLGDSDDVAHAEGEARSTHSEATDETALAVLREIASEARALRRLLSQPIE